MQKIGHWLCFGFVMPIKASRKSNKAIDRGLGRLRAIRKQKTSAGQGACTLEDRQECLSLPISVRENRAGGYL